MPGPYPLMMEGIDSFNEPVSYRYEVQTPFGLLIQYLSVDIKILIQHPESIPAIGISLWSSIIATAISRSCSLSLMWYVRWRAGPLALPAGMLFTPEGHQGGTPANKNHTAIVLLHTGHADGYAARRLYLPSTPLSWQADGMLTARGWDALMPIMQGASMGLSADVMGGDLQLLNAYPRVIPPTLENLAGVLFRRVTHLKVMQYTDKAPDYNSDVWP